MPAQEHPVRIQRKTAITFEGGWNSLAGVGINVSYAPVSKFAIDLGSGLGLQGFKGGIRGRYFFLDSNLSPYFGMGYMIAPNQLDGYPVRDENGDLFMVNLLPSHYGQFVLGIEYMSQGGFVIGANIGYALLIKGGIEAARNNVSIEPVEQILDLLFGSGIAFGVNLGYSF